MMNVDINGRFIVIANVVIQSPQQFPLGWALKFNKGIANMKAQIIILILTEREVTQHCVYLSWTTHLSCVLIRCQLILYHKRA